MIVKRVTSADVASQEKRLLRELNLWANYNTPNATFTKIRIEVHESRAVWYYFTYHETYNVHQGVIHDFCWNFSALYPTAQDLENYTTAAKEAMLNALVPNNGVAV